MNRQHRWTSYLTIALAATIAMTAGCQSRKPANMNAGPPTEQQVERIRESFEAQNPKVQVGVVVDLIASQNLAAVGDVNVADFHIGEVVCFIDANSNPIVCGTVLRITPDQVHVKYEAPAPGHRAPVPGDIAVGFGGSTIATNSASNQPTTQP